MFMLVYWITIYAENKVTHIAQEGKHTYVCVNAML